MTAKQKYAHALREMDRMTADDKRVIASMIHVFAIAPPRTRQVYRLTATFLSKAIRWEREDAAKARRRKAVK